MFLGRIFLILTLMYAVTACIDTESGMNNNPNSDTGTFEAVTDDEGNPVPLTLKSSANGTVSVTSAASGNSYSFRTVDSDGNPVGGVEVDFVERDTASLEVEEENPVSEDEATAVPLEDMNLIPAEDREPETVVDYGDSLYSGDFVTVTAKDPTGKYKTIIKIIPVEAGAVAERSSITGRLSLTYDLALTELPAPEQKTYAWDKVVGDADVSVDFGDYYWYYYDDYSRTMPRLALDMVLWFQGTNSSYTEYDREKAYVVFRESRRGETYAELELTNNFTVEEGMEGLKNLAAEYYGGEPEDYDRKQFNLYTTNVNENGKRVHVYIVSKSSYDGVATYPKDYNLNYVYAKKYNYYSDNEDYYYVGYLYRSNYSSYSYSTLYFTVKEDMGDFKAGKLYYYTSSDNYRKLITEPGTYDNFKFYLSYNTHVVAIDKPVMTYEGDKLIIPGDEDENYSSYYEYETSSHKYHQLTIDDLADGKFTMNFEVSDVGNDEQEMKYLYVYYYDNNTSTHVNEDAEVSEIATVDVENGEIVFTLPEDKSITSFSVYFSLQDGYFRTSYSAYGYITNRAPTISGTPETTATAGVEYSFTPTASDPDGDSLTYKAYYLPDWLSLDSATGTVSGSPAESDVGTSNSFRLYVTDGLRYAWLDTANITVEPSLSISGTPDATVNVNSAYSFSPTIGGSGTEVTFTITNKPSWADFDTATGALTGTPSSGDQNTYSNIVISATNGTATKSLDSFSITVPNRAPAISGTPTTTVAGGSAYSFTPTGFDADDDSLTFSISNKPSWASFSTSTGSLTGTPTGADAGTASGIVITVSDGTASASLTSFDITVTNSAPTISGTPSLSVYADGSYDFTPTNSDANGDTLTFSIENQPSWTSFDTASGRLYGMPLVEDIGTFSNITITASDGTDSSSLDAFAISVVNSPPEISGTPETSATVGTAYSFTPTATDDNEDDTLTFSKSGDLPDGLTFSTADGSISGTPTATGTFADIVITVSDGTDNDSLDAFTITVSSNAVAQSFIVLKTGQTSSVTANDDGTYQAGTAKSLSRSGDSVTDNATGLMWADSTDIASDTYTWAGAAAYCDGLSQDGYDDWRMPTLHEMTTIVDYGTGDNALESVFVNSSASYYWTSNEKGSNAYIVGMFQGDDVYTPQTDTFYVRCVRQDMTGAGELSRDAGTETITDSTNNLMWEDGATAASNTLSWTNAISYCENLDFASHADWRLPNINELRSIMDYSATGNTNALFENVNTSGNYWSSTTIYNGFSTDGTWSMYLWAGGVGSPADKTFDVLDTRCVRSTN